MTCLWGSPSLVLLLLQYPFQPHKISSVTGHKFVHTAQNDDFSSVFLLPIAAAAARGKKRSSISAWLPRFNKATYNIERRLICFSGSAGLAGWSFHMSGL